MSAGGKKKGSPYTKQTLLLLLLGIHYSYVGIIVGSKGSFNIRDPLY